MTTTADPIHGDRRNENRETRTVDYWCRRHGWVTVEWHNPNLRFMDDHRACVPTLDTVEEAVALLDQLRSRYEWVSVFWDRGWGESDDRLEISIIEGGNGQVPRAYITPDVYERLVVFVVVNPNTLQTFKARKIHDYEPGVVE